MKFISERTLERALAAMWGTADHMLKIWITLKKMGLQVGGQPVVITTQNPNQALIRLFGFGDAAEKLFVPFAHTKRFATMSGEAGRSIIQTNIRRWQESGSVVGNDPTGYLDFGVGQDEAVFVSAGRNYPIGLGYGRNGFALQDGTKIALPFLAFSVWYCRQSDIPDGVDAAAYVQELTRAELHISPAEEEAVFVSRDLSVDTQSIRMNDRAVNQVVSSFLDRDAVRVQELVQDWQVYQRRIKSMTSIQKGPAWLRSDPDHRLRRLVEDGAKAVLLYGPPRTGKTRAVDALVASDDARRATIQLHDGWGYDELMLSLRPGANGSWDWHRGPLLQAINDGKKFIVLEEANRTQLTQALGEVFQLLEPAYRGSKYSITLRNGDLFFIPEDVVFLAIVNLLDKSTEDLDDALLGRLAGVEFTPRVEALAELLAARKVAPEVRLNLCEFFATVQEFYPLGHGYFSGFSPETDAVDFYLARIRPVLQVRFQNYRDEHLDAIDNAFDDLFGT